jgi:hypothetical protein
MGIQPVERRFHTALAHFATQAGFERAHRGRHRSAPRQPEPPDDRGDRSHDGEPSDREPDGGQTLPCRFTAFQERDDAEHAGGHGRKGNAPRDDDPDPCVSRPGAQGGGPIDSAFRARSHDLRLVGAPIADSDHLRLNGGAREGARIAVRASCLRFAKHERDRTATRRARSDGRR